MDIEMTQRSVFDRLGRSTKPYFRNQVCSFWLAGRCNKNPCRFLHSDLPNPQPQKRRPYDHCSSNNFKSNWRNPSLSTSKNVTISSSTSKDVTISSSTGSVTSEVDHVNQKKVKNVTVQSSIGAVISEVDNGNQKKALTTERPSSVVGSCRKPEEKLCQYWVTGNCSHGDKCKDLHSWFSGCGFSLVAKLERHEKAVTGIALPSGSDKLFSSSKDESVCIWDCNTGQCVTNVQLGGEIGCLISEGPWVFVGLQNAVKARNIQTETEHVLTGPNGLVNAMVTSDDILFAGVQDGSILAWKSGSESSCPTTLKGHRLAVLSLVVGANRLYSGSKDGTIRVWDIKTLQCVQTLEAHTDFVTSLTCWDSFLFSGSLDKTLKVWGATESGSLEVKHEIKEDGGVLSLCGIHDAEEKPILLCSYTDNTVRLYELPSFTERGRIFSKKEVQTVEIGCGGIFFTGDAKGEISVWRLH